MPFSLRSDGGGEQQRQAAPPPPQAILSSSSASDSHTSLRPPGYPSQEEQRERKRQQNGSSSPPTAGPPVIGLLIAAGVITLMAAKSRARRAHHQAQMISSLTEARDRAAASESAWREAYKSAMAGNVGRPPAAQPPCGSYQPDGQQQLQPNMRPEQKVTPAPSGNSSSGFIDPRVAAQAAREEQEALDNMAIGGVGRNSSRSSMLGEMASGLGQFMGMATGRGDPFPGGGPWMKRGAGPGWADGGAAEASAKSSSEGNCARKPAAALNPRQRWQRAFGAGAGQSTQATPQAVSNDDAAWERLAQKQEARSKVANLDDQPQTATAEGPSMSGPNRAAVTRAQKRLAEMRKEAKLQRQQKVDADKAKRIDSAILDELDAAFFANHLNGSAANGHATEASASEMEEGNDQVKTNATAATLDASSPAQRNQHVSMDNVFLEQQLQDAAEEGRELRLQREQREARTASSPDATNATISSLLRGRNKRDGIRTVAAKEAATAKHDRFVEELAAELLGRPASQAPASEATASDSIVDVEVAEEQQQHQHERASSNMSLLDAALEHAAQEGRDVRARQQRSASSSSPQPRSINGTWDDAQWRDFPLARTILSSQSVLYRGSGLTEEDTTAPFEVAVSKDAHKSPEEWRAERERLEKVIGDLRGRMENMDDQVGKMNVWADEVHRRLGYHGRYPGSRDKPN
ncbi:hypothetical protein BDZ90DRAFT_230887 [Jaminaea rosea]|uniref:Uncharacterized protein n=1 Tax=Jaminaea rosea TaxID=1569628 RepID=A0A316UUB9_9BASI|nr:hypothetical protein BDZ90DRAFT_230887 [Jaminaea rosea]PWN28879.1 hypothetical protein BDZ90DRAFT_230887 [Jaminaea rosea]